MKDPIEKVVKQGVSWLADSGPEDDIAISSRIRLARNILGIPFPVNANRDQMKSVMKAVELATERTSCIANPIELKIGEMSMLDRHILLERRLISREMVGGEKNFSAVIFSEDESHGIMVNEEDHIRMQVMKPGLQLGEVWKEIDTMDSLLGQELSFSFSDEIGYLTSCPTNVGTGIRASVMLHLPSLALAEQINGVIQAINKLGLAARGIFGEGTENLGSLYQISNQSTLGETEDQIIEKLESVIKQIISHEKNSRKILLENRREFLLNFVGRAYGILRHSYMISSQEALNSLSALRLGVDMGMFTSVDIHKVNELFLLVQPAHLQKFAAKELEPEERDILRAKIIREKLHQK